MKTIGYAALLLAAAAAGGFAQQWEFGAESAASLAPGIPVTAPSGSATAGFAPGAAFSVFVGHNEYRHLAGELRYGYLMGDLRIQSGGSTVSFPGAEHVIHYDLILHTAAESRAQFFVAFGGGVKVFQGTGVESASQPLMQYAVLTRGRELEPMASVGAGVKVAIVKRLMVRAEVRDYISPVPTQLIAPALNATFGHGFMHDFVPMLGLSCAF